MYKIKYDFYYFNFLPYKTCVYFQRLSGSQSSVNITTLNNLFFV